jgi:hypothetical protein
MIPPTFIFGILLGTVLEHAIPMESWLEVAEYSTFLLVFWIIVNLLFERDVAK